MVALRYQADVLRTVADMERIAADWDVLAARWGTPVLKADWFLACAETLYDESALRVIVVRYHGGLCAVAPLVLVKRRGVEWLELLGASVLYEPTGLIFDGSASLRYLVKTIMGFRIPTVFDRIPVDSPIGTELRNEACLRGVVIARNTAPAAYVITKGTWDDHFRSLSGKSRYEFRRLRKNMERVGPVEVRIERPSSRARLKVMLHELFQVEAAGWKGRSGTAMLANDRVRQFIIRYSERATDQNTLCFCFLYVQGQPIAASLSVQDAQRFWGLKIGYDEGWAQCAPGIQLTMETMKYAFECGLEAVEFLGSEESWQARWPLQRHHFLSLVFYPMSLRGLQAVTGDFRRFAWRRMRQLVATAASRTNGPVQSQENYGMGVA